MYLLMTRAFLLLVATMPVVAVVSPARHAGNGQAAASGQEATRSLPMARWAGSDLYLFLGNRKLNCANENMDPDGGLGNCSLRGGRAGWTGQKSNLAIYGMCRADAKWALSSRSTSRQR